MKSVKAKIAAIGVVMAAGASVWALPASILPGRIAERTTISVVPSHGVITGDYVEARTAAVFAGACHYNGEYVTTGRDALMAWHFTSGMQNGVSLANVRVVAAVTSQENLSETSAPHKTEIVVDPAATSEQVNAVVSLLKTKCGDVLGTIVEVRRTPITFSRSDKGYSVDATGFGAMSVKYLPDDSCCTQPGDVWYEPLSPIQRRKVGYTEAATFTGTLTATWHRFAENSAFYGQFSF